MSGQVGSRFSPNQYPLFQVGDASACPIQNSKLPILRAVCNGANAMSLTPWNCQSLGFGAFVIVLPKSNIETESSPNSLLLTPPEHAESPFRDWPNTHRSLSFKRGFAMGVPRKVIPRIFSDLKRKRRKTTEEMNKTGEKGRERIIKYGKRSPQKLNGKK